MFSRYLSLLLSLPHSVRLLPISKRAHTHTHRGLIQRCKHIQFIETSLYIFGESASGTITSITITNGNGYHEILFPLRAGVIRLQQRFESVTMVNYMVSSGIVLRFAQFFFLFIFI